MNAAETVNFKFSWLGNMKSRRPPMIRAVTLLAILCSLAGCASDPKTMKLAEVDLDDPNAIQEIRVRLDVPDRQAFNDFVFRHYTASAHFCGRALIRRDGKPPETVGEAITLTLIRQAKERQDTSKAARPKTPRERARERWDDLISERDMLIDAQALLREKHGPAAHNRSEWRATEARLGAIDKGLIAIKPQVFGAGE